MPCNIAISSVVGTTSGGNLDSITVTGTVSGCTDVLVEILCVSKAFQTATLSGNTFSATFSANQITGLGCGCGNAITVTVKCDDGVNTCQDVTTLTLPCDCPDPILQAQIGGCNPDGTRNVTISAGHTNAGYGPQADIDFGNGGNSGIFTFSPGLYSFQTTYAPGTYTIILNHLPCPPKEISLVITDCDPCPYIQGSASVDTDCDAQGMRNVALIPDFLPGYNGPPVGAYWEFGDNTPNSLYFQLDPVVPPVATNHNYLPGTYTAVLHVVGCRP